MDERFNEAYRISLGLLHRHDRFEAEIVHHLESKGFADDAPSVVERLRNQGILNDRRVAAAIISGREGRKSVGRELLRQRLLQRGAPESLIDEFLREEDESAKALRALEAKFGREVPRPKAGRFLYSRGFAEDAIESALERFYSS